MTASNQQVLTGFAQAVTLDPAFESHHNPIGCIADASIVLDAGKIVWVGHSADCPAFYQSWPTTHYNGKTVMPGFIDSHTHPVFAGDRADEMALKLAGQSYPDIAANGGGIRKTVQATRAASEDDLLALTQQRLQTMHRFGVTTVEAKSGYGLTLDDELKSLRVLKRLVKTLPMRIIPTLMAAHDIPPEYENNPEGYVDLICEQIIPTVAEERLAVYQDVFCETGYFTTEQCERMLETGKKLGLLPRIHAEEFSNLEGAAMAVRLGAASADHLLHLSDVGIAILANSETIATLLPGTAFYLRLPDYAPARKMIDAGVKVAIATDFNPGSCPMANLQLAMQLACLQMGMLPHEVIRGVTQHAAQAVGLGDKIGSLSIGKQADLVILDEKDYQQVFYQLGVNLVSTVYVSGQQTV